MSINTYSGLFFGAMTIPPASGKILFIGKYNKRILKGIIVSCV